MLLIMGPYLSSPHMPSPFIRIRGYQCIAVRNIYRVLIVPLLPWSLPSTHPTPLHGLHPMRSSNRSWQDLAKAKKLRQQEAIPPAWILASPPSNDVLDVRSFPDSPQCGLLSDREIEITNTIDEVFCHMLIYLRDRFGSSPR